LKEKKSKNPILGGKASTKEGKKRRTGKRNFREILSEEKQPPSLGEGDTVKRKKDASSTRASASPLTDAQSCTTKKPVRKCLKRVRGGQKKQAEPREEKQHRRKKRKRRFGTGETVFS